MHYVGMDCHITTLEFAVVNEAGRLVMARSVPTSVSAFMEFVKTVPLPRTIYMEEGTLAAWAAETCVRFRETLVITDPKQNHWISSSAQKDDPRDALKLARLARGGYIKEIHHPVGQRRHFRELMLAYHDAVKSSTWIKNKIKARFRQNGIHCTGATVYGEAHRDEWKEMLRHEPTALLIVDGLWRQLKQAEQTEKELLDTARVHAKRYPQIKLFEALPGIGFISAATVSSILETPYRFANKRKVWMYAGLGVTTRSSGGRTYSQKLSTDYNRLLKHIMKQAVESALRAADNPFQRKYLDMTLRSGIAPHRAKLTVARDMLATMWAMWEKGEKYDPRIREKAANKQV